MKVKLELGMRRYEQLHAKSEGRGRETLIKKATLRLLLIDLSRLYGMAVANDVDIEEPGP